MTTHKKLLKIGITVIFIFVSLSSISFGLAGRPVKVNGYQKQDQITGGEGWVNYSFFGNNYLDIISNVNMEVNLQFNPQLHNRQIALNINNSEPIDLHLDTLPYSDDFSQMQLKQARNRYRNKWDSYIHIHTNVSVSIIEITVIKNSTQSVGDGDKWALYDDSEGWILLDTVESETSVNTTIVSTSPDIYLSVFAPSINYTPFIIIGSVVGVILISLSILMSKTEYREFIRNRIITQPARYTLSIEDVLENENRSKIIDLILESPGIHFNELLRETELSPGNLVWHLDVLETYRIIGKKNVGQYLVYFPLHDHNPMSNIDIKLAKSDTTLQILNMIEDHPGTYANEIAEKLHLDHKTIKYHLEKLKENELIEDKRIGRKNLLYPHLNVNDLYKNGRNHD